jgi:hypothetical protein
MLKIVFQKLAEHGLGHMQQCAYIHLEPQKLVKEAEP